MQYIILLCNMQYKISLHFAAGAGDPDQRGAEHRAAVHDRSRRRRPAPRRRRPGSPPPPPAPRAETGPDATKCYKLLLIIFIVIRK